jgi:hypothetical protein
MNVAHGPSDSRASDLRDALLANRDGVATALAEAEEELEDLHQRGEELEDLVKRARLILGLAATGGPDGSRQLTLHEAMALVLRTARGGMSAPELAGEVGRRHLYRRRDGRPAEPAQIHARVNAYASMFERRGGRIVLREPSSHGRDK